MASPMFLPSMSPELSLTNLYLQELRALPRTRYALSGLGLFALVLTVLAVVVIPSPLGMWSFALLVYGLGPVLLGAFAALQMSNLRVSRLTHSLYTLPVRSRTVLGANLLVALTLAAFFLAATLPFLVVAALHITVPLSVLRLLLGGAFLLVFAVTFGTLVGVFFTGRSVAAPVGLTIAFLFLAMLAIPPSALLQSDGALQGSLLMQVLHMSPYVLVSDGLGLLGPSVAAVARSPGLALFIVTLQIVTMLAITTWVFVREQGPERWESGPTRRVALVVLATLVVLGVPLAVADDAYAPLDVEKSDRYGSSSRTDGAWLTLVPRETAAADADFRTDGAGTAADPLDATGPNPRDLLIRLPVAAHAALQDVRVTLEADPYLTVDTKMVVMEQVTGAERDAHGVVLRIPVVLTPLDPLDLTGNTYQLWTNVTYRADGEDRTGQVISALQADVPWAHAQLGAAGAPLVVVATVGAISRRLRVG